MAHPRCLDRAAAVTAALAAAGAALLSAGPASAEPPDGYAPNPPTPPDPPTLTMSTPEVVEGTGGPNEMVFTFTLDEPASGGESFRFYTEDAQGSALPVEDHEPLLEFPVFGAGDTELTVAIPLVTDNVPEANEHILVHMDHPTGLAIPDGAGTGIIIDDDIPTIAIDDVTLPEGSGGPTGFHFTVSLSEPSTVDVYVSATPAAGSADADTDWQALPHLVQFAPGETSHEVAVSVVGDHTPEPDETFTVELSDADYATLADATGLGTILDDDHRESGTRGGTEDPDREPGRPTRPAADDLAPATTTTTTTTRPTALAATPTASNEEATIDLRPAAAIVLTVLGLLSLLAAWRARQGEPSGR